MESTVYQEIMAEGRAEGRVEGRVEGRAEGRVEGQRELVALLVAKRLGGGAEPLVLRLSLCTEATLARAAELVATVSADADLVTALDGLLPRAEEG